MIKVPGGLEVFAHWLGWSLLFEFICRAFMPHTTGDPWDVLAYAVGPRWLAFGGSAPGDRRRATNGGMSFDSLAAHYRWMEWLLAGRKLQRCRTAFLRRINPPREVLLLGEGNGRFLEALLQAHPQARVTCVDASAAMLERARARMAAAAGISPTFHSCTPIFSRGPLRRRNLI